MESFYQNYASFRRKLFPMFIWILLLLFSQRAYTQYTIKGVFGIGGASLASSEHKLIGTLGQPGIGVSVEPAYKASLGFWYTRSGFVSGIAGEKILPLKFQLEQNYPNPFNPSTTIAFEIPKSSPVYLEIYDITGKRLRTLIGGERYEPGRWEIQWNGMDEQGNLVSSGMYVVRLMTGNFVYTRKMLLMK